MYHKEHDTLVQAMREHRRIAQEHANVGNSAANTHAAVATAIGTELLVELVETIWGSLEGLHDRINRCEMSLDNIAATAGRR